MFYVKFGLVLCSIPLLVCLVAAIVMLVDLFYSSIIYRLKRMFIKTPEASYANIPDYSPAVLGYLIHNQKIGSKEVISTLFDLIGKGVIKIEMPGGQINDDKGQYVLILSSEKKDVNNYEKVLIDYLFKEYDGERDTINDKILQNALHVKNINRAFLSRFSKEVQNEAKTHDFFSNKVGKRKKFINWLANDITVKLIEISKFLFLMPLMPVFALVTGEWNLFVDMINIGSDVGNEVGAESTTELILHCVIFFVILPIVIGAIVRGMHYLVALFYNITCRYNGYSENGEKEWAHWMGFRKYLINATSLPEHPIMGVLIWEKYFAYSIELGCSKRFYKQIIAMKISDNLINVAVLEFSKYLMECFSDSVSTVKSLSIDEFGGSHINY